MLSTEFKELLNKHYTENFPPKEFVPGESHVPVSGKIFDTRELELMTESVLDGWWTEGRFNDEFEKNLGEFIGRKHAITTNSGSSANLLAISALTSKKLGECALKTGDEVITMAAGFPTTINPILQHGLIPVFVDAKIPTYGPNMEEVEAAIGEKTKAIFIAHTLGNPYDLDKIKKLCDKHDLWMIEDNCDALGSKYKDNYTGTYGHIATLSFYPAHHITMGEGGALLTDDPKLAKVIRSIRDWGRDCWCRTGHDASCNKRFSWKLGNLPYGYDHKYTFSEIGYNLKITDMQAALGVAQLEKLEGFIAARRKNFDYLKEGLKDLQEYLILPEPERDTAPSWFGFPITLSDKCKFTRDELQRHLDEKKIGSRLLFAGNIVKQPYFVDRDLLYRSIGELANTDLIMNNTLWIGVYPGLSKEMLDYVIETITNYASNE